MKSKFKLTLLSILITSCFSMNAYSAIKGYKEKDNKQVSENKKDEDNGFWFFKGYKTEEQKSEIKDNKKNEIKIKKKPKPSNILVNVDNFSNPPLEKVDNVELLRPSYATHIVNENETLWGIAVKYYNNGNLWNKILADNPSISNPNKLVKGQKILINDINTNFNEKKYSQININPYLLNHILHDVIILEEEHKFNKNKIIASENQQKAIKLTDKFYVSKTDINLNEIYNIYRFNKSVEAFASEYIDELALMKTSKVKYYLMKDDILIKQEFDIRESFNRISDKKLKTSGEVLSIVNNKKTATLFDLIILNLTNEKIETGSVATIYSQPLKIVDEYSGIESIVPSKELAEVIVVKSESDFSLAIISKSIDYVNVGDTIK